MSCILSSVEGESDPRNLVVVFELLHFMLLNFCQGEKEDLMVEQMIEDIFDKVSCYYPINFKPPKDDKFKITPN